MPLVQEPSFARHALSALIPPPRRYSIPTPAPPTALLVELLQILWDPLPVVIVWREQKVPRGNTGLLKALWIVLPGSILHLQV